ncbi:MAG: PHP domain-containing protein, partial [Pseudomonadota bacterium]
MPEFTHLHLHTQYSLLDGAIRLDHLFPKVLERGMKSVAITDHGNLFGALDFYQRAKAHGVKPIFGCETYVAPDRHDKTERRSNHLILLAKNEVGWKNLSYLNSMGYLEGFYYNPRIDKPLLRAHAEGLIGMSACLGGEIAQALMRRGPEAGETAAREFEDIFGKGNFADRIGELCNVEFKLGQTFLPKFQVPDGMTAESYLQAVAEDGLKKRIDEAHKRGDKVDGDVYAARLALELSVIKKMEFAGYFLIVWDFIRYAKEHRIPVGPGRGSGAGSLVAYCTRITDIDPISNKLLFERFLNPERVSMPDFDVDFCMNRRDEVISYVTDKYGKDNVGQIVTMHQIKARSGVRDIARAMAIPFAEADKVAKFVPEPIQGKSPPIAEAIDKEPRLRAL